MKKIFSKLLVACLIINVALPSFMKNVPVRNISGHSVVAPLIDAHPDPEDTTT